MSEQELPELTPEQRRSYIRTQIPLVNWFNRSGAEILSELRQRGYGIGTTDFYAIRREKLAASDIEQALEYLGPNDTIPVSLAETQSDWNLSKEYLFQFKVVGRDPVSGDKKVAFFALSSDTTLAKQEAVDAIGGMLGADESFYEISAEEISLYQMYSRS